jgi:hypothetical protein
VLCILRTYIYTVSTYPTNYMCINLSTSPYWSKIFTGIQPTDRNLCQLKRNMRVNINIPVWHITDYLYCTYYSIIRSQLYEDHLYMSDHFTDYAMYVFWIGMWFSLHRSRQKTITIYIYIINSFFLKSLTLPLRYGYVRGYRKYYFKAIYCNNWVHYFLYFKSY